MTTLSSLIPKTPWNIHYVLACALLLRLLKVKPLPSRETVIPPSQERVLILGASSGVGRDLAHIYAKRGARICLVARRKEELEKVEEECMAYQHTSTVYHLRGKDPGNLIICMDGDVTDISRLIEIRAKIVQGWGGLDTLHILPGVPSTHTLMDLAGTPLRKSGNPLNPLATRTFANTAGDSVGKDRSSGPSTSASSNVEPTVEGLQRVADDARACGEVNYIGTTLALAAFLPLLASTSKSPALHHLSSVAATIPAPRRAVYSATKAAALMLVESCRVECEGSGVRFFSLLPGTIANGFRRKSAIPALQGRDELDEDIEHDWESLLLQPKRVTDAIMHHLSLNPAPAPLIPFWPISWIPWLKVPPKGMVHMPWQYRMAFLIMRDTPLGWLYLEPNARKKYGIAT